MKRYTTLLCCFLLASLGACSVQGNEQPAFEDEELELVHMVDEELELVRMVDEEVGAPLEVVHMVETAGVSPIPDTPQGYRILAMLDALQSEDDAQLSPFVAEHYDDDFLVQVPESDHRELLRKIREQLKQTEIESVSSQLGEYRLELLDTQSSKKWVLDIHFQPTAPYKISGIRML
jgi:hypothetical protein